MMPGNVQLAVPPGFRFHPTDEELLYYYLRKKVCYEAIDLDVIREVDLNKLEPWDLKDKCKIGSGPQNEWYFFSHKDKKYPTGTRTNRATTAGFWKATGRDKAIHHHHHHHQTSGSKRIGMRKTLVFYTGRAPHGQKTDWIMHEYRLHGDPNTNISVPEVQESDGWVVCRVFKKKNQNRSNLLPNCQPGGDEAEDYDQLQAADDHDDANKMINGNGQNPKQSFLQLQAQAAACTPYNIYGSHPSCTALHHGSNMHLPQLLSSPHDHPTSTDGSIGHMVMMENDINLEQSCLLSSLTSSSSSGNCGCGTAGQVFNNNHPASQFTNAGADWSFLDKLLASTHHQSSGRALAHDPMHGAALGLGLDHHYHQSKFNQLLPSSAQPVVFRRDDPNSSQIGVGVFPFQYIGHQN